MPMMGVAAPAGARIRTELVALVRERRRELEATIVVRIQAGSSGDAGEADAEYVMGMRSAVSTAIEFGLTCIEHGPDLAGPVPAEVLVQARRAARVGVSAETVLRRYVLGNTVLGDYLMQESDSGDLPAHGPTLRDMLAKQAVALERLMATVLVEYSRELESGRRSPEHRRARLVNALLEGKGVNSSELGYELEGWHVGAIVNGSGASETLREVAVQAGTTLLCVTRGESAAAWAWFGAPRRVAAADLQLAFERVGGNEDVSLVLGEPAQGVEGWRCTHLQAQAALRVALRGSRRLTRYADVVLLASVLRDDTLAASLGEIYLAPLGSRQNGGEALRRTLRAYFAAEHNASSAAVALGVTRHTVQNRLRAVEEKLGQALNVCQAELEVALRLEELEDGVMAAAK
jgi:hypothetical protein